MTEMQAVREGWDFMSQIVGADFSSQQGMNGFLYESETNAHICEINDAIQKLSDDINQHAYKNLGIEQFKGYAAEEWHADTFNIHAIENNSEHRAWAVHSTEDASPDINSNFGKQYSLKYIRSPEETAKAQAIYSRAAETPKYHGQERLVPSDQFSEARDYSDRRAAKDIYTRPEVSNSYRESSEHLTNAVSDENGIESEELSLKEARIIAKEAKNGTFEPEKHGFEKQEEIQYNYIKNGIQAGMTAAMVTAIMQIVPELYKAVDYLIKKGEIDLKQLKKSGQNIMTASAESFLRGTTAYTVEVALQKGFFGESLKSIDPSIVGVMVTIVIGTVKNSILVAAGRMQPKKMGEALVDNIVISAGYLAGAKIGGALMQALGWEFPCASYLLGSLIGCAVSVVYNIGKNKLISFCVDTGFTCFGLVEQDYKLPESVLDELGINTIELNRTEIHHTPVETRSVQNSIARNEYETIDITVLRRGIIGVNKVGYVL